jgi:hypothetical protein
MPFTPRQLFPSRFAGTIAQMMPVPGRIAGTVDLLKLMNADQAIQENDLTGK